MKAKKHSPFDFSALHDEAEPGSPAGMLVEPPPEASIDFDLSIGEAPRELPASPAPKLGEGKPLANLFVTSETTPESVLGPVKESKALAKRRATATKPRVAQAAKPAESGGGAAVYAAATLVAALWALGPIAFAVGYRQNAMPLRNDDFAMIVFALLAIGPAAFVFFAAYMIRQSAKLSAEAKRTRDLSQQMLTPAALAAAGAADAVAEVRAQIEHAAGMASEARDQMLSLRETLAHEAAALELATTGSAHSAAEMTGSIGLEREAMQTLAAVLDQQSAAITEAIGRQARMVAEASDLAETQLREAEAALAARAADLASAAVAASDAARTGAEDVARHAARLESAGSTVTAQLQAVDAGLAQQRNALTGAAEALRAEQEALRAEQEDFAVQVESRAAQLADLTDQARQGAEDLGDQAVQSAESLRGLITAAAEQFQRMAQAAQSERDTIGEAAAGSFEALRNAATDQRAALAQEMHAISETAAGSFEVLRNAAGEQRAALTQEMQTAIDTLAAAADKARTATEGQVEAAKSKVDQLHEAAVSVGQKADAVFEARVQEARELIEQSAVMAEQAGARSAQRLDEGVSAARAAVDEVERLLSDVGARTNALGAEAKSQAAAVREVVEHGMSELLASARKAAEETQAIDAAFQDRIKRNYDMLTEAVSLMGTVAAAAPSRHAAGLRHARPAAPPVETHAPAPQPAAQPAAPHAGPADGEAPRQRLRLTPTTSDEEFRSVFVDEPPAAPPQPAPPQTREEINGPPSAPAEEGGSWTWKDLLGGLTRSPAAESAPQADSAPQANAAPQASASQVHDNADGRRLAGEIAHMGIDAAALLPRMRIDEIAAIVQAGDARGGREVIKRLAPAAVRRLVRRLFSDRQLRSDAEQFLDRYGAMVQTAIEQDRQGFLLTTLLGSEMGRTYLLLDAAAGDVG
jgi:hypothetical protein